MPQKSKGYSPLQPDPIDSDGGDLYDPARQQRPSYSQKQNILILVTLVSSIVLNLVLGFLCWQTRGNHTVSGGTVFGMITKLDPSLRSLMIKSRPTQRDVYSIFSGWPL